MPQLSRGISKTISKKASTTFFFGAVAVSLTFGAVQFASGRDLSSVAPSADPQDRLQSAFREALQEPSAPSEVAINRAAKADRAVGVAGSPVQSKTILLQLEGLSDTSVLVRVPVAQARSGASSAPSTSSSGRRMTVACEPVVSVLTEVAKLLQPGRCVT
jgi:hypothetical protein